MHIAFPGWVYTVGGADGWNKAEFAREIWCVWAIVVKYFAYISARKSGTGIDLSSDARSDIGIVCWCKRRSRYGVGLDEECFDIMCIDVGRGGDVEWIVCCGFI